MSEKTIITRLNSLVEHGKMNQAEADELLAVWRANSSLSKVMNINKYCCHKCGGPLPITSIKQAEPGKISQADVRQRVADTLLQDSIETLGTAPDKRFVTYNNQVIDLERVMYLETFKTGNGYWIILDGSTWNSESDCYNNAPYIQSDVAEEFKQVWMTYLTYKKN